MYLTLILPVYMYIYQEFASKLNIGGKRSREKREKGKKRREKLFQGLYFSISHIKTHV